jgi:hypothetical protein
MVGVLLLVVGAGITATGIVRARGPWARYRALKAQEDNIARYESWRGGLRDSGPTGASVAMDLYRRQARDGVILIGVGAVIAIAGLLVR